MFSTALAFGQQQDEGLIKKVVASEVQDFLDASRELENNWHLKPYSVLYVSNTAKNNTWAWLPEIEDIKRWFSEPKNPFTGAKLTQSNHKIRISGDLAFVLFDQQIELATDSTLYSKELKILEKIDGTWKITATSAHFFDKQ